MIRDVNYMHELKELSKNRRVLIDVWANWCGPCKQMSPVLYDLDQELSPQLVNQGREELRILKIDTDNPNVEGFLANHNIRAVPTFIVYENETVIATHVGATTKNKFRDFILNNFVYTQGG